MAPVIKLNSGYDMPQVGFGLWKVDNAVASDVVYNAIKAGYRLFDGACGKSCLRMLFPTFSPEQKQGNGRVGWVLALAGRSAWRDVEGKEQRSGIYPASYPPSLHPRWRGRILPDPCRLSVHLRPRCKRQKGTAHGMWTIVELCQAPRTP